MNINLALFHIYAKYTDKYLIKITAGKKMYHYNLNLVAMTTMKQVHNKLKKALIEFIDGVRESSKNLLLFLLHLLFLLF